MFRQPLAHSRRNRGKCGSRTGSIGKSSTGNGALQGCIVKVRLGLHRVTSDLTVEPYESDARGNCVGALLVLPWGQ